MKPTGERLGALRRAYRARGARRGASDMAYSLYLAALMTPLVAFPILRAVVLALAAPPSLAALVGPSSVAAVGAALGLTLAGLVWLGALYGPVNLEPAFVRLLADTDLPHHRALVRPFVTKAAIAVAALLAAAVLFGGVFMGAGVAGLGGAVRFMALCAVFAVVGAVTWLAGQAASPRVAGLVGGLLTVLTVLGLAVPAVGAVLPWDWVAVAWPPAATSFALSDVALVLLAFVAVGAARPLLDLLRSARLAEDAARWRAVGTAALSGDVAHALGGLRARPSVGRRWRAVRGGPSAALFLVRDLVGAARTPVRLAVGVVSLVVAVVLLAVATSLPTGWVLAAFGAALAYLALGALTDGFRHATDAAVAPPLYGYTTPALFIRHGLAPLAVALVSTAVGVGAAAVLGVGVRVLPVCAVLVLVVLIRAFDSAKGPLPVLLLTPMPSPFGDLSSLNVSLWQADAFLIALVTGALAVAAAPGSPVDLLVLTGVVAGVLVIGLRRRLGRL
ncbi:MAG: hypothetical protein KJ792_14115 [Actinobacteria bacterium]|nr:hypothetical protein [Actinomycetota bacterium]MCG2803279.1 hypothetical protein [Cellulomonas sp.]